MLLKILIYELSEIVRQHPEYADKHVRVPLHDSGEYDDMIADITYVDKTSTAVYLMTDTRDGWDLLQLEQEEREFLAFIDME